MNELDTKRFHEVYGRFEAGEQIEALGELRELAGSLADPWDRAELIYHETMFLLEMGRIPEAKRRLGDLAEAVATLTATPQDTCEIDIRTSLPVMARYAELKVTIAEGKEAQALRLLEDLVSRYPKQLSAPDFRAISDEVKTQHGFLLADLSRWAEARPFLEGASPPEMWKGILCYYLGHCYYTLHEYERAKNKLVEGLDLGMTSRWEAKAHYVLGLVEYHLSDVKAAKRQFELFAKTAEPEYFDATKIWEWLETTSRELGLYDEAENYRKHRIDSPPESKVN